MRQCSQWESKARTSVTIVERIFQVAKIGSTLATWPLFAIVAEYRSFYLQLGAKWGFMKCY